ncbi:response regulator transcription factor [Sphingobacterium sp. N143]|uniref:LytR/AlgR family response regulator transcription factor n=1 Tax=Sphingobacterium sp. N143 TaxID=2746727 RepID=UPI002576D3C2|nr:LytTR family DNA-binding domain-containing protein [Sphingobacterium sp. N143]MDM1295290.1 response regulator transcription factor [Sphingobacterium sp. N143]
MSKIWIGVIIDDQQACIDHLLEMVTEISYVDIVRTFNNPQEAKIFLRANKVDFIILDVELGKTNAFDFLRTLPSSNLKTILYTAHRQYEDPGYDINVVDVLLKEVSKSRFYAALRRVDEALGKLIPIIGHDSLEHYSHYFMIKGPVRYDRTEVRLKNVIYVESSNGHVIFHQIGNKTSVCNSSLKEVKERLPVKWFMQCHKSFIINNSFFYSYGADGILMTEGTKKKIPVGDKKLYPDFFNFINSNILGG